MGDLVVRDRVALALWRFACPPKLRNELAPPPVFVEMADAVVAELAAIRKESPAAVAMADYLRNVEAMDRAGFLERYGKDDAAASQVENAAAEVRRRRSSSTTPSKTKPKQIVAVDGPAADGCFVGEEAAVVIAEPVSAVVSVDALRECRDAIDRFNADPSEDARAAVAEAFRRVGDRYRPHLSVRIGV